VVNKGIGGLLSASISKVNRDKSTRFWGGRFGKRGLWKRNEDYGGSERTIVVVKDEVSWFLFMGSHGES
jgi:hypothetical protein